MNMMLVKVNWESSWERMHQSSVIATNNSQTLANYNRNDDPLPDSRRWKIEDIQ